MKYLAFDFYVEEISQVAHDISEDDSSDDEIDPNLAQEMQGLSQEYLDARKEKIEEELNQCRTKLKGKLAKKIKKIQRSDKVMTLKKLKAERKVIALLEKQGVQKQEAQQYPEVEKEIDRVIDEEIMFCKSKIVQ